MSDRSGRPAAVATSAGSSVTYGPKSSSKEEPKETSAQEKAEKAKSGRWEGIVTGSHKDKSSLSVRGGQKNMESMERQIFYDSSTEWTKQGKPAEQSEFKEGSFVIVLGHPDDKGVFHATRVDLRLPR